MTRSYYIYYRSPADATRVRAVVEAMQLALTQATGVAGRLLHRVDDRATWMEVYEDVDDPDRFEGELALAVERFGLQSLLAAGAERHVERFTTD
jgi:hypothetical protein